MPKVIISSPVWSLNGINVFSHELASGLRGRGYDAQILLTGVTYRERKPLPLPRDVPMEQLPIPRYATWSARRRALKEYIERNAPCVYLPNHDFSHSCITASLAPDVGVIGIVHSDDEQHYDHFRRVGSTWNAIVAVSSRICERLVSLNLVEKARIHTVPYGVNVPPRLAPRNGQPLRIIYTGRLEEKQKRVSDLVRIASKLAARGIQFEMSIVGDGPERRHLARAIEESGLADRVTMTGTVGPARAAELCAEHDVFLMPSVYEGMPISLLEAMAQGCVPVVRRSESGIPEVVTDGENGLIVDSGIDGFVDGIQRIAADDVLRRSMSERAWATMTSSRFEIGKMIERYAELIDNVAAESVSRGFVRGASNAACPRMSLRDTLAAPLWTLRPAIRAQQNLSH